MNVLLTGGAGYIARHTAVVLTMAGYHVIALDNLSNSQISVIDSLKKITGKSIKFIHGDVRDGALLSRIMQDNQIDAVIHFAGLKAVGQSVQEPLLYYDNNVGGTISLLEAMKANGLKKLIFSSSATVYGAPKYLPYDEQHPTMPTNPYGWTKLQIEQILRDLCGSDAGWSAVCLRYFNPVGAHESGLIGENPQGVPNNLMPFIARVAGGQLPYLNIFGNDYETKDGTGERDYIHVMDLADGHLAALEYLKRCSGWDVVNLGSGRPHSVLEMVQEFEKASRKTIRINFASRRPGDLAKSFADPNKAKALLGWTAKRSLEQMCTSVWMYQENFNS